MQNFRAFFGFRMILQSSHPVMPKWLVTLFLPCSLTSHWRKSSFRQAPWCWMVNRGSFAPRGGLQLWQVSHQHFCQLRDFSFLKCGSLGPHPTSATWIYRQEEEDQLDDVRKGDVPSHHVEVHDNASGTTWPFHTLPTLQYSLFVNPTGWLMEKKNNNFLIVV